MRRRGLIALIFATLGCIGAGSPPDNREKIYYAVRSDDGMVLWEPGESENECMDVFGRTRQIERIVPVDDRRHKIAAVVTNASGMEIHPPTLSSIGGAVSISSSAFVKVHGRQQFLKCGLDTVHIMLAARRLPDE